MQCPLCIKTGDRTEYETAELLDAHRGEVHGRREGDARPHPETEMSSSSTAPPADEPYRGGVAPEQLYRPKPTMDQLEALVRQLARDTAAECHRLDVAVQSLLSSTGATHSDVAQIKPQLDHFSSEIGSIRDLVDRVAGEVASEAAGAGRAIADLERKVSEDISVLESRLGAQEQQTFGERLRRLEEHAGFVPTRPGELEQSEGAPHRPPADPE